MESQNGIKTWQWVVTGIVIVVLIVIGVIVFGGKGTKAPTTTDQGTETIVDQNGGTNRIVMTDQYPGNVAFLSSVQVATTSWIVIQSDNNGVPGKVLGSTRFESGINTGKVTLSEPMLDGSTYYAVIYTDAGSKTFDSSKNTPLKDSKGQVIMKVFKASSSVGASLKG
jgi:hypothetical protein